MNYEECYNLLTSRTFFNSFAGLTRMKDELKKLGHPELACPVIHVAGTNGKGSVCAMLHSVLSKEGYRIGLFTSPFLEDFRERIQINGEMISKEDLIRVTESVLTVTDGYSEAPNQFELVTLIALRYFSEQKCDLVILETGLGGTYDPTNCVEKPLLTIITNIGLDHSAILGNTIPEIAAAKAGIIKEGVPCIVYPSSEEALHVFRTVADKKHAALTVVSKSDVTDACFSENEEHFTYRNRTVSVGLPGEHQRYNAAVVLEAVDFLKRGFKISERSVSDGLKKVTWPARLEKLSDKPLMYLDGGHNPQCIEAVIRFLKTNFPNKKLVFIISILKDKDYETMLRMLSECSAQLYFVKLSLPRAIDSQTLEELAARYPITVLGNPEEEIAGLVSNASDDTVFCFTGSLFLAGTFRAFLQQKNGNHIVE